MRGVREYKQKSIVSGLSIQDILNMDAYQISKLNEKDLRKITGRLVSAGNKRLRRAEKAGVTSSAIRYVQETGAFSTKGKTFNQLRHEFLRARNYLEAKGGTIKGAKQIQKETVGEMKKSGINISTKTFDTTMSAFEKVRRLDPSVSSKEMKYRVIEQIDMHVQKGMDEDTIVRTVQKDLNRIYKEKEQEAGESGVSQFFNVD